MEKNKNYGYFSKKLKTFHLAPPFHLAPQHQFRTSSIPHTFIKQHTFSSSYQQKLKLFDFFYLTKVFCHLQYTRQHISKHGCKILLWYFFQYIEKCAELMILIGPKNLPIKIHKF